jgi:hypothetical protein
MLDFLLIVKIKHLIFKKITLFIGNFHRRKSYKFRTSVFTCGFRFSFPAAAAWPLVFPAPEQSRAAAGKRENQGSFIFRA